MAKLKRPPTHGEIKYVTFVEKHWHQHMRFPSAVISSKELKVSINQIDEYNQSDIVKSMFDNRGIEIDAVNRSVLTEAQLAAANCYLDITDRRPIHQKLNDLGIANIKFQGWLRNPNFKKYIQERAEELFDDAMPFAHRQLVQKVMDGDIKALRLFYEISGRYTGTQSVEQQNIALAMQRLIEAIQMEVSDPDTLQRIATRFKAISEGKNPVTVIENKPALPPPVVKSTPNSPPPVEVEKTAPANKNSSLGMEF